MATRPFDHQTRWMVAPPMFRIGGVIGTYGTTEATPITTLLPHEERIPGTSLVRSLRPVGRGVEIKVVDDSGAELPSARWASSSCAAPASWPVTGASRRRRPRSCAVTDTGPGDPVYRDEQSYIFLVDRAKDMIVSGGENSYSTEVEEAPSSHPGVEEVAISGVPGPRWGEAVYMVVHSRQQVTPDELAAHCRQRIAGFKVPRRIDEPLPKSAAGKILERELREPHWAGHQTHVFGG